MLIDMVQGWWPQVPSVIGLNERNRRLIYPNNDVQDYKFADDKLLTKKVLEKHGLSAPRTYAAIGRVGDIEKVWEHIPAVDDLVIKPARGMGGNGILLLHKEHGQWNLDGSPVEEAEIFAHIAQIIFGMYSGGDDDRAILEELIVPHPALTSFYEGGIPDIRIITMSGRPLMAMLRLPTSESGGKANLHQGGVGVGIDLDTGAMTYAYDGRKYRTSHPDSDVAIVGGAIPQWDEILRLAEDVAASFPLGYLGIDIVLDKTRGPLVLEVNVRPGLGIQLANHTGMKAALTAQDRPGVQQNGRP